MTQQKRKGINWRKSTGAYVVRPTWNKRTFYVGSFANFDDAEDALEQFNALTLNATQSIDNVDEQVAEVERAIAAARNSRARKMKKERTTRRMGLYQKVAELETRIEQLERK